MQPGGTLYVAKDTGAAFVVLENNVLIPVKVDARNALNVASYAIAEGDTADGVWHCRFHSNGYVEYDGTLTLNNVYFILALATRFMSQAKRMFCFHTILCSCQQYLLRKLKRFQHPLLPG